MRTSSIPLRIKVILLCMLALSGIATMNRAASADETLARTTAAGREVLVRGFAEFDRACEREHVQTIAVVEPPSHGRVEQRPGVVTIDADQAGKTSCAGAKVDGVQIYYVPDDGWIGNDRFAIDVASRSRRVVHAKVDVTVGGDAVR